MLILWPNFVLCLVQLHHIEFTDTPSWAHPYFTLLGRSLVSQPQNLSLGLGALLLLAEDS